MHYIEEFKPNILIANSLPSTELITLMQKIRESSPVTHVITIADTADEALLHRLLTAGAKGILTRETNSAELALAIDQVKAGWFYLSPPMREYVVKAFLRVSPRASSEAHLALSKREHEIFRQVAQGYSAKEIGRRLKISPRTVETHRANIMRKLGLRNRAELVRYAIEQGILRN